VEELGSRPNVLSVGRVQLSPSACIGDLLLEARSPGAGVAPPQRGRALRGPRGHPLTIHDVKGEHVPVCTNVEFQALHPSIVGVARPLAAIGVVLSPDRC